MKRAFLMAALLLATSLPAQEPAATRVYELAEVETQPVPANVEALRSALEATYPADKQAAGQGATVSVAFVLGADGTPRDVSVTHSTDAAFDSATVAAMALLRFTPATVGGQPVAVRVEVPVQWEPDAPAEAGTHVADAEVHGTGEDSGAARTYELASVDELPRVRNMDAFQRELLRLYPAALRDAGIEGVVQVSLVVTEQGEVVNARVTDSSDPRFDAATIAAAGTLRFRPARIDGRAVRTRVDLPIRWTAEQRAPRP